MYGQTARDAPRATATTAQPAAPSLVPSSPNSPGTRSPALPDAWLREVVDRAGVGRCERSRFILASLSTNNAFPLACRSWTCPTCQRTKWRAARELVERGMRAAFERGDEVRFLTLTDGSRTGNMTIKQLSQSWDDLAKLLRAGGPAPARPSRGSGAEAQRRWRDACRSRRSFLSEYALVLEVGPRGGRLHAHVMLTGRYVHQPKLAARARHCGFGLVVDIRSVNASSADEVARYASKLAGYSSKAGQEVAQMRSRASRRLRPLRTSRRWHPGGLRQVEADLGIRGSGPSDDLGPWVLIQHDGAGVITSAKPL